jgi:hypothetical protein
MNTEIIDTLAKGSVESFNLGVQLERKRVLELLQKMSDIAFATQSEVGGHTVWAIEHAIELIKETGQ